MINAQRCDQMDAQRYDPSKRELNHLSCIKPNHPRDNDERAGSSFFDNPLAQFLNSGGTRPGYAVFPIQLNPDPSVVSLQDGDELPDQSNTLHEDPSSVPAPGSRSARPRHDVGPGSVGKVRYTDTVHQSEYTTTRTILHPVQKVDSLGCLPCSPPSISCLCPTSPPSLLNLHSLNCFSSGNAFELDVDFRQKKWEREVAGGGGIEIFVTQSEEREYDEGGCTGLRNTESPRAFTSRRRDGYVFDQDTIRGVTVVCFRSK